MRIAPPTEKAASSNRGPFTRSGGIVGKADPFARNAEDVLVHHALIGLVLEGLGGVFAGGNVRDLHQGRAPHRRCDALIGAVLGQEGRLGAQLDADVAARLGDARHGDLHETRVGGAGQHRRRHERDHAAFRGARESLLTGRHWKSSPRRQPPGACV